MPGEPILIVDDTPVNLKLTRILLVNEGYKVLTAGSAEEALEMLQSAHPALILADVQLPGMDGLEMTRRIKQDERTRDIAVVALTAFAMQGDERRAVEAGCDGYITKPIDTRTLGGKIRELLDRRPTAAQSPVPPPENIPAKEMEALRARFLNEGAERARELLVELDGVFDAGAMARAVHQWVGTGGLLGFRNVSRLAREVEALLRERPVDTAQVRESMTELVTAFAGGIGSAVSSAISQALAGRRVALAGLPADETGRICLALERVEAHPEFFDLAQAPDRPNLGSCDLAVIYVHALAPGSPWLNAHSGPTVFVGSHDDLLALPPNVESIASELLVDAWVPDEALVRMTRALAREGRRTQGGSRKVWVGGADESLASAFESAGLELADTVESAGAAVIDLSAGEPFHSFGIPTLAVITRAQESGMIETDVADYVVKPFGPLELVARLRRILGGAIS